MNTHDLEHEPEVHFDIDVEVPADFEAPWAEETDVVELGALAQSE